MQTLKIIIFIFCIGLVAACSKVKELTDTDLTANMSTTLKNQPYPTDYDLSEMATSKLNSMMLAAAQAEGSEQTIQFVGKNPEQKNSKQMVNEMYSAFPLISKAELNKFIEITQTRNYKTLDSDLLNQLNTVDFSKDIIVIVSNAKMSASSMMSQFGTSPTTTPPQTASIISRVKRVGDMSQDLHLDITFSYIGSEEGLLNTQLYNPEWDTEFYIVPKDDKTKLFITFADKNLHDEYTL